jgi:hypothetical protein
LGVEYGIGVGVGWVGGLIMGLVFFELMAVG